MENQHGAKREDVPSLQKSTVTRDMSPDTVNKEHKDFKNRVRKYLKLPDRAELASSKDDFEKCLREIGKEESPELGQLAIDEFRAAAGTFTTYEEKNRRGLRRANTALQESLCAVSRFVAAYSSIVDAVSKTAGPYAEVGYQTMTVLLIVVVTKGKNNTKIMTELDNIREMLPRLKRWEEVYTHEAMTQILSEIYLAVITFSRAAVEYFCHTWERLLCATIPNLMDKFDEAAKLIYVTLARVHAEASQSSHERLKRIEGTIVTLKAERARDMHILSTQNEELKTQIAGLRAQNDGLKAQNDELLVTVEAQGLQKEERDKQADEDMFKQLEESMPDLATEPASNEKVNIGSHPCFDLRLAKERLQAAFPNIKDRNRKLPWTLFTQMTPATIVDHPSFPSWLTAQSSSLLFIHGRTRTEGRALAAQAPCWLSPAALHVVEHLRHLDEVAGREIVYFSCRPGAEYSVKRSTDVLLMLSIRLISTSKQILRDRFYDFRSLLALQSPISLRTPSPTSLRTPSTSWTGSDYGAAFPTLSPASTSTNPALEQSTYERASSIGGQEQRGPSLRQLVGLLSQVLFELQKQQARLRDTSTENQTTAYLVLDRLECVDGGNFKRIMNELTRLVAEDGSFRVKILVVVEDSLAEASWDKNMLPKSDRVFEVNLDQRKLERSEMTGRARPIWE